eukprot:gene14649-16167_t
MPGEAVRSLKVADLAQDDGLDILLAELDKVYLKEETTRAFCAVKAFVEFRRESGMNFTKFLVEFNNRYRELKKYKLDLNDGLCGYFLLASANLSADHERLVRATAKLSFEDDKLQKLLVYNIIYKGKGQHGLRRGYRVVEDHSRLEKGRGKTGNQPKKTNPADKDGNLMRCHECESIKHFVSDCPHRQVESANMTVHLTLVAGTASDGQEQLLLNTLGKGILDTACTKSVAGEV